MECLANLSFVVEYHPALMQGGVISAILECLPFESWDLNCYQNATVIINNLLSCQDDEILQTAKSTLSLPGVCSNSIDIVPEEDQMDIRSWMYFLRSAVTQVAAGEMEKFVLGLNTQRNRSQSTPLQKMKNHHGHYPLEVYNPDDSSDGSVANKIASEMQNSATTTNVLVR